jgi:hypothetical protein
MDDEDIVAFTKEQVLAQLSEREQVVFLKRIGSLDPETVVYSARGAENLIEKYWDNIPEERRGSLEEAVAAAYETDIRMRYRRNDISASERTIFPTR